MQTKTETDGTDKNSQGVESYDGKCIRHFSHLNYVHITAVEYDILLSTALCLHLISLAR